MKIKSFIGFFVLTLVLCSGNDNDIIHLPLKIKDGYSEFKASVGMLGKATSPESSWYKTLPKATGVPDDWILVNKWFDAHQFAYQNYKQGNLTEEFFNHLKTSWEIELDKRPFSEKPIKCFISVIYHKDSSGNYKCKIDTNNDLDFSDEVEFIPAKSSSNMDSLAKIHSLKVRYEAFRNGKVVELTTPFLVLEGVNWDFLLYNIPQYGEAELNGTKLYVRSDRFHSTNYKDASILKEKDSQYEIVEKNEYIQIGDDIYQNLGVNINKEILSLKKMPRGVEIYSSQRGFKAKPFEGKDFLTEEKISLDLYKGKFLYLEFWGSWCRPCISEIPHLKKAYNEIDTTKIDFLGVAKDKPEALRKTLKEKEIVWKQILFEKEEGIIKDYNITSYPSSFLIDPNGKIIARGLRGQNLSDTLNYFIGE